MALELVGGAFLGALFNVLLDRVVSPEINNLFKAKNLNKKLLNKLKLKLLSVRGVLEDAEGKQTRNSAVKDWLDELKSAAFDADDLLDEIYTLAKTRPNEVRNLYFSSLNSGERGLEKDLEEILERLIVLVKEKDALCLREGETSRFSSKFPSTSLVDESAVYGRNDDKETIIRLLMEDDPNGKKISVIPIVGMGGIGKTTLAQLVYNDDRVKDRFELKAWVCVSEEFDVVMITKTLLEAVASRSYSTDDLNSLQVDLRERLNGKKFLIVLDDVWNESYVVWCDLQIPFQYGAQGSKIIVTTRSVHVASVMQTMECYNLEHLSHEDCWNLFARHAFDYNDSTKQPILEEIGREIVKKCKGLPLAAKTLGGLLRSKNDIVEWENILKSDIWDLSEKESQIIPALRLSYYYLPSHLKQCFAYCSIFHKGYEFKKSQLILLWMAENLLQQSKENRRMEEVGDDYFCALVARSFFQQSRRDKSCFLMHDLINDLAQFVSGKYCMRMESDDSYKKIVSSVRHLSFVDGYENYYVKFEAFYEAKNLRTLLPLGELVYDIKELNFQETLSKLRYLRVLSLARFYELQELPDSISFLRHLRYLDVSGTRIQFLPESVCNLYNLQTLKCAYLTKLPEGLHNLTNLRYLEFDGLLLEGMPPHMGKLTSLQQLTCFTIGKKYGSSISELGNLLHLRGSLTIQNLQHVNVEDAKEAKLKDKKYLEHLRLFWEKNDSWTNRSNVQQENNIIDNLRPPSRNLKVLEIHNYMGSTFPNWLGDPSFCSLASLWLQGCKFSCILPPLGQLPSLKRLCISDFDGVVRIGPEFYGETSSAADVPFASLELLVFIHMCDWEKWCHVTGTGSYKAFPHLRQLRIKNCPRLTGDLPSNLPCLTKVLIEDCPNLQFPVNGNASQYYQSFETLEVCNSYETDTSDSRHEKDILDSLQPHTKNLRILKVSYYLGTEFSNWLGDPSLCNVVSVWLEGCKYCCVLPPLGQLLSLKHLSIVNFKTLVNVGPEFYRSCSAAVDLIQPFASLESLEFENMQAWEKWDNVIGNASHSAFPRLRQLHIVGCTKLTGDLPSNIPFLTELKIVSCPNLSFPVHENADQCYHSLKSFEMISSCDSLRSFPLDHFPNLKHLSFRSCVNLESLRASVNEEDDKSRLKHLKPVIVRCPNFRDSNLRNLSFKDCLDVVVPVRVSVQEGGERPPGNLKPGRLNITKLDVDSSYKLRAPLKKKSHFPSSEEIEALNCPETELSEINYL